jgi:hypothetical protein
MNTSVFGQHDPGKTPTGKTSKRDRYIMEISSKCYKEKMNQKNLIQSMSSSQVRQWSSFSTCTPCLGLCALCLGVHLALAFAPFPCSLTFACVLALEYLLASLLSFCAQDLGAPFCPCLMHTYTQVCPSPHKEGALSILCAPPLKNAPKQASSSSNKCAYLLGCTPLSSKCASSPWMCPPCLLAPSILKKTNSSPHAPFSSPNPHFLSSSSLNSFK